MLWWWSQSILHLPRIIHLSLKTHSALPSTASSSHCNRAYIGIGNHWKATLRKLILFEIRIRDHALSPLSFFQLNREGTRVTTCTTCKLTISLDQVWCKRSTNPRQPDPNGIDQEKWRISASKIEWSNPVACSPVASDWIGLECLVFRCKVRLLRFVKRQSKSLKKKWELKWDR